MRNGERESGVQSLTSDEVEAQYADIKKQRQPDALLEQPYTAKTLFVPKSNATSEYTLSMQDWSHPDKVVLYKVMIAAYNYAFFDKTAAKSAKNVFASSAFPFITWLNDYSVENRYNILKQYEAERMDELQNHGGYSPLIGLRNILLHAINSVHFQEEVELEDYLFIRELRATKISPNLNKAQKSLANYFGALDWLRDDEIGIGGKLYTGLASPKLTVNSLSLTAATVILQMSEYKVALSRLFEKAQPEFTTLMDVDFASLSRERIKTHIGTVLYRLISAYHQSKEKPPSLRSVLEVLLLSNTTSEENYLKLIGALGTQESCDALFLNKIRRKQRVNSDFCRYNITSDGSGSLFSLEVLCALWRDEAQVITVIERAIFGWLMAGLAVQPYDIPKLTNRDFRKLEVGGRVRQIECEYFKGRARVFHTTRALSVRDIEGQALLTYLDSAQDGELLCTTHEWDIRNGIRSITGLLRLLLQSEGMHAAVEAAHSKKKIPVLMPKALCALIKSGVHTSNVSLVRKKQLTQERWALGKDLRSPCPKCLFGLQAIKNSAVHAFSDPYTYEYLLNSNSHSNKTEKSSYLTEDNEQWMNSSGRITREVMFDLIQNVFNLDFSHDNEEKVAAFNSEFMAVSEGISYKSEEMNARLRLVTGQGKGRVDEVGVLSLNNTKNEPLEPIYVIDSPLTVLKMLNYLHEFKKHYKKLLATNPDLLFKTVMPTAEWIEATLGKMSQHAVHMGTKQFNEMTKKGVVMSVFHSL
ncbi:hypothetical protein ACEV76_17565 [Vibrio parahaemolyticus]|uniref:hypothetical protein n=1 Tax=Vibrio parahaemolyticus TaxID=670 RepID=UPI000A38BBDF|nr:hypothetical protein [Vibrio parahaemolyticus]OUJ63505.1 hypothetical protein BTO03_00080 [Vibrio parahaemolyticus]TOA42468.1 hypothetical protein CGK28_00080 [Vibrio parahaemolyticus]HCH6177419.1 hypothetical protein [Vibrio parahaemolyticus]